MGIDKTKGWFVVPGIREQADRTLDEQMEGLGAAIVEAQGKSVLDLGCAEAMISLQFAKAGAKRVLGVEVLEHHLQIARQVCKDHASIIELKHARVEHLIASKFDEKFDIVLALAVIHKLTDMEAGLEFALRACNGLFVLRAPVDLKKSGYLKHKRIYSRVHLATVMKRNGFTLESSVDGPRGEPVQYWRRVVGLG